MESTDHVFARLATSVETNRLVLAHLKEAIGDVSGLMVETRPADDPGKAVTVVGNARSGVPWRLGEAVRLYEALRAMPHVDQVEPRPLVDGITVVWSPRVPSGTVRGRESPGSSG